MSHFATENQYFEAKYFLANYFLKSLKLSSSNRSGKINLVQKTKVVQNLILHLLGSSKYSSVLKYFCYSNFNILKEFFSKGTTSLILILLDNLKLKNRRFRENTQFYFMFLSEFNITNFLKWQCCSMLLISKKHAKNISVLQKNKCPDSRKS